MTVRVDGVASTVVGVMPAEFGFPDREELWLPLVALPRAKNVAESARSGRPRHDATGTTNEQAAMSSSGITASLAERYPDANRTPRPASGRLASPRTDALPG